MSLAGGVLVLAGPTATGKSELAAELARVVGGEVVSADSRQVYRGLEVGTAQPDARLRARVPHRLVGFLSPAARYTAGDYGADARRVLAALAARGRPAVLCGGTGLYLRAVLEGAPGPGLERGPDLANGRPPAAAARRERRTALASRWVTEGAQALHAELAKIDPALAVRVHPRDRQRVLRGLEFHAAQGRALSTAWRTQRVAAVRRTRGAGEESRGGAARAHRFRLEVTAEELDRRIARRLETMLERGLLDEARALFARYGAEPPVSLSAVGYPELFAHFRGEVDLAGALERIRRRTRQYAKRQRTWFRNQDGYVPVAADERAFAVVLAAWREAADP